MDGEVDDVIDEIGFSGLAGAQGGLGHVGAVDVGVAGEHFEGSGEACHLEVGVFEEVFLLFVFFGGLVEANHGVDLLFYFLANVDDEFVFVDLFLI